MSDLISRQAVKEWLERWEGYLDTDMIARMQLKVDDIPTHQTPSNTLGALDCVERQAAIDALNKRARDNFTLADGYQWYLGALHDVADDIRQLPSVQPKKWIPVSERLPEDEQVVLVQDTNGTMWIWKYLGENLEYRGPYQWMDDNEVWQLIDEVLAWMPLPECYGGD